MYFFGKCSIFEKVLVILFCNKGNCGLKILSCLFFTSKIMGCLSISLFSKFKFFGLGTSSSSFTEEILSSSSVVSSLDSLSFFFFSILFKEKSSLL